MSLLLSPFSKVKVTPYSTTITSPMSPLSLLSPTSTVISTVSPKTRITTIISPMPPVPQVVPMSPVISPIFYRTGPPVYSPPLSPLLFPTTSRKHSAPLSPLFVSSSVLPVYNLEVETGLNENPFAQKQMLDFIMAKVYNNWIYGKNMCYVLKYLKIVNGKVHYLSRIDEFKNNKICDDSESDVELKVDFIEENILTKTDLKRLLKRMIDELGLKWFQFPEKLDIIEEAVEKHIKNSLKEKIGTLVH